MRSSRVRDLALSCLGLGTVLAAWELAAGLALVDPLFLPAPADVARSAWASLRDGALLADAGTSIWRVFGGFLLGALIAVPLGVVIASVRSVEALLQPLIEFLRYLPVPAFVPLCIVWFGIGDFGKIVVIFLGTFFQLVVLVADDARAVPRELVEVAYTLRVKPAQALFRVVFPGALPSIWDHLRVCIGWAWSYVVVAEIVAAERGLGFSIMQAQRYLHTADAMTAILVIGLIGLATDRAFRLAARLLFPYRA